MSKSVSSQRTEAPADVLSPQINYYDDHVTIRVPNGQWNEALQELAQSAKVTSDPRAVAKLIASERSQPAANQDVPKAARPVLQWDPRDEIPLTHCNKTRRIIGLVGFIVSSVTIFGVHVASIADRVPGFQPLTIYEMQQGEDPAVFKLNNIVGLSCLAIGNLILAVLVASLWRH